MFDFHTYRLDVACALDTLTRSECIMFETHSLCIVRNILEAVFLDNCFRNLHHPRIGLMNLTFEQSDIA